MQVMLILSDISVPCTCCQALLKQAVAASNRD